MKISHAVTPVIAGLAAALIVTACGSTHASAGAKASAIASSSFTQAQTTALETELTNAFQAQIKAHPSHPLTDAKAAVRQVFPSGDTTKIEAVAVKDFTPAVLTTKGPGSTRDKYFMAVVAYATTSGGVTPPASPGPLGTSSTASIPGVSSPSATASP